VVVDMSFSSNNTFPYKNKVDGGVMGSRDVLCLYNLPIKKTKSIYYLTLVKQDELNSMFFFPPMLSLFSFFLECMHKVKFYFMRNH
jgi:hypothetical protein